MTTYTPPPEAVEAAARAAGMYGRVAQDGLTPEQQFERDWQDEEYRDRALGRARAALTAAGPIIAAEALQEAAQDEHPCGDYPAPCNCDDPETHDGAVPAAGGDAVLDRAAAAFADAWTGVATLREGVRAALTAAVPLIERSVGERVAEGIERLRDSLTDDPDRAALELLIEDAARIAREEANHG